LVVGLPLSAFVFSLSDYFVDFVALSIAIVAFGITIYEMDRTHKNDRLQITTNLLNKLGNEESRKAWDLVINCVDWYKDYDKQLRVRQLYATLNQTGLLMYRELIDDWMVLELYHYKIIQLWRKLKDYFKETQEEIPFFYHMTHFKFLYDESINWAKTNKTLLTEYLNSES
jgi:hypothetical protein